MEKLVAVGPTGRLIVGLFALGLGLGLGVAIVAVALGFGGGSGSVEAQTGGGTQAVCVSSFTGQARFMYPGQPANCNPGEFAVELGSGAAVDALEARLSAVEAQVPNCLSEEAGDAVFTGCDVEVRNGLGRTDSTNGKGNLIVGYNENQVAFNRDGSHNIVVGQDHGYSSFGGLVVGLQNTISGAYASVSGGFDNEASGFFSSVSGGSDNEASGLDSSVSGGESNTANGPQSSVSGGILNTAEGDNSSVSGGTANLASGERSSVSGGDNNTASGLRVQRQWWVRQRGQCPY